MDTARTLWVLGVMAVVAVGCGSAPLDGSENAGAASEGALTEATLMFEGTCDFLHSCSSYSKHLPAGEVSWGCDGVEVCDDSAHWLAGPSHAYCGRTMQLCRNGVCTTARVKDVSDAHGWEGSTGVMKALGLPHGLSGKCSGFGGGQVTLTRI